MAEAKTSFEDDGPGVMDRLLGDAPAGSFVTYSTPVMRTELADGSAVKVPHGKLTVHWSGVGAPALDPIALVTQQGAPIDRQTGFELLAAIAEETFVAKLRKESR